MFIHFVSVPKSHTALNLSIFVFGNFNTSVVLDVQKHVCSRAFAHEQARQLCELEGTTLHH